MEDTQIIDLYWQRDETAIAETDRKYGPFCGSIALNLLGVREDAEECVSDTWHQAWLSMPPQRPDKLKAWLGRIVRNLSINRWRRNHAQKRYGGVEQLLSELEDCVPSPQSMEKELEDAELGELISRWLKLLPQEDRVLFTRRYWHGAALKDLAEERDIPPAKLAQRMYKLRLSLKSALEKEGVYL